MILNIIYYVENIFASLKNKFIIWILWRIEKLGNTLK